MAITKAVGPEAFNPDDIPGFHVMLGNQLLGTYETENDAECFIAQQVVPGGNKATIVEGCE